MAQRNISKCCKSLENTARQNGLSSGNPGGYSPINGYTSIANIADTAYIDSKMAAATK
jgi:hypothetical protein